MKVPVVIVRSAAKSAWVVTKFAAGHLAKPVAKAVFLRATPFLLKSAGKFALKRGLPLAAKVALL